MNVRFEYLYRDAGNYKNWGDAIFSNVKNHDVPSLEQQVRESLIDGEFFVAEAAEVPVLRFPEYVRSLDHDWHEFYGLVPTEEIVSDVKNRSIDDFIKILSREHDDLGEKLE